MNKQEGVGTFARIYRAGNLVKNLRKKYNRPKAIVKIFYKTPLSKDDALMDVYWGTASEGHNLFDCTRFQNICAVYDMAPRVYALEKVLHGGVSYAVQLVEDVGKPDPWKERDGRQHKALHDKIIEINDEYGGVRLKNTDSTYDNSIRGKYIDFQSFGLDREVYKEKLSQQIRDYTWGRLYQSVPELDITDSFRDTSKRVNELGLNLVNFKGKTVLDIGCSNGQFSNYAFIGGAQTITAVDLPVMIGPAMALSNYLGHFNIDYEAKDLQKESIKGQYDIVFYFSMISHIGFPSWVKKTLKPGGRLYFEASGAQTPFMEQGIKKILSNRFSNVEYKGKTTDYGRDLYLCW